MSRHPTNGGRWARTRAHLRALARHRRTRPAFGRLHRRGLRVAAHTATVLLILSVPSAAFADAGDSLYLAAPNSLPVVIAGLQKWLMGILFALATLFLVLAGVYWATAGGDPAQVDKAKGALRNALMGYGLAVLAPVMLQVVKGIVGG